MPGETQERVNGEEKCRSVICGWALKWCCLLRRTGEICLQPQCTFKGLVNQFSVQLTNLTTFWHPPSPRSRINVPPWKNKTYLYPQAIFILDCMGVEKPASETPTIMSKQ